MATTVEAIAALRAGAWTVSATASPPSLPSFEACAAMPLVTRALSLFWVIEADIASIEEVVSSTEAACSLADCDSDCAVDETWAAALVSASPAARTSSLICASFSLLSLASFFSRSNTPEASRVMRWPRSPLARPPSTRATSSITSARVWLVTFAFRRTSPNAPW